MDDGQRLNFFRLLDKANIFSLFSIYSVHIAIRIDLRTYIYLNALWNSIYQTL